MRPSFPLSFFSTISISTWRVSPMKTGETNLNPSTPQKAMIVSLMNPSWSKNPVITAKVNAPWAILWPKRDFAANSLSVWRGFQSPLIPAKLTISLSVTVLPDEVYFSPTVMSSKNFPV